MPALECKYSVADDDFVPSSIISTAIRFSLFCWILCANAYILVTLGSPTGCPNGDDCCNPQPFWVLIMYLFGDLLLEFSVMTVSFLILVVSASGTLEERFSDLRGFKQGWNEGSRNPAVVNQSRLSTLRLLISTRTVLFFPELCFSVLGLVVAFHTQLLKQPGCKSNNIYQLLAAYSIVTTLVCMLKIVYYLAALDPAGWCSPGPIDYIKATEGDYHRTHGKHGRRRKAQHTLHRNRTTQLWQKRIKLLACGSVNGAQNVNSSVLEASRLFSVVFHDQFPNYTISDIATAIVLLNKVQKECCNSHPSKECFKLRMLREKLIEQMRDFEFCDGKDQYRYQPPVSVNLSNPAEFTEVKDAIYYFQYAMAAYGWPLYLFGNPMTGCCKLCYMSCRICCAKGKCCSCSEAAFKLETPMHVTKDNVIAHGSEKNGVFFCPYKVVLDHDKKAVVVAIRGTLSVEDAITSLSISLTPLLVDEPPYDTLDTQVHKGWYTTAKHLLEDLNRNNLFKHFDENPKYRLVVVGHSLGGAVAAVLSVLIKMEHKEHAHRLKSFGYSTPGCVFTYPLAKYCHDFVTTVALDNDLLPRLTWRSMLLLRATLKEKLETCDKPKHQILYTDHILATCSKDKSKSEQDDVDGESGASAAEKGKQEDVQVGESGAPGQAKDRPRDRQDVKVKDNYSTFRAFVNSVYDQPDWKVLGPFCGEDMSFETAVNTFVAARKWERKAGVQVRPLEKRFENGNPRAFLPGRVIQIDTEKERFWPRLPWPKRSHCQLKWVANEDYCQMLLHGGPLSSHLPNNVYNALNMVNKLHPQQSERDFDLNLSPKTPDSTFGQRYAAEEEDDFYHQEEAAASETDPSGLSTRVVTAEVVETIV